VVTNRVVQIKASVPMEAPLVVIPAPH